MIYFYKVPQSFLQVFAKVGVEPVPVDEIPTGDPQNTIIWYAKTEDDVLLYGKMNGFGRRIILGSETLTLESSSVTALLLRQANVEMYYPFMASHITKILDPERHWYNPHQEGQQKLTDQNIPILFSGSGKETLAVWGDSYVGKTSIVLSLAAGLAGTKARVLVIDSTNNCDLFYRINLADPQKTITVQDVYKSLLKNNPPKLYRMTNQLDILPRDISALSSDEFMYVVDSLKSKYDFILFDVSSTPDEIGHLALKIASRVLLVANYDIVPLSIWYTNVFKLYLLPEHKITVVLNGVYPSKYTNRKDILSFLNLKYLNQVPSAYQYTMDAKLGETSPYLLADDEYREAIDSIIKKLWSIERNQDFGLITKAKGFFKKQ